MARSRTAPKERAPSYTVKPDGVGGYRVEREESFDAVTDKFGALMADITNHRTAKKEMDQIEKLYFRDGAVAPGQEGGGFLMFDPIAATDTLAITVVVFVENQQFQFK